MQTDHERLMALYKLARALRQQEFQPEAVLQTALVTTAQAMGVQHGCLMTFYPDNRLGHKFILGPQANKTATYNLWQELIGRGLVAQVRHGRRITITADAHQEARWPRLPDTPEELLNGSAIGLPLEKRGTLFGVLAFLHPAPNAFNAELVEWLKAVADLLVTFVANIPEPASLPDSAGDRYRWLFEDAVVPILITSLDGYILDVNRKVCDFLKYTREELLRQPITAVHRMGTGPIGANRFGSLQEGKEIVFNTTAWPKEGEDIPVIVRARRLTFGDQDVIAWVEQDMTTQMELEQLRQDLTAMVYHDLRGPLHTIYSSLTTLNRLLKDEPAEAVQALLDVGTRGTQQLSRLVESLLDIQRLEEGKAVLDPRPAAIDTLLDGAVRLVAPLVYESDQTLEVYVGDHLPPVTCDEDMIRRVATNLLENAVKYTPMGGRIQLRAERVDEGIRIAVSDSGPGIPRHMQRQIFDKFSRVKYKDAPKGVGLGLAFCRLAVEAHGGQIWVESELEEGSSFIFTLPITTETAPARP